jgi:hypothetical protein
MLNNFMGWVALAAEVSVDAAVVGSSFFRGMSFFLCWVQAGIVCF